MRGAVATAGVAVLPYVTLPAGAPRHSQAATTFTRRVLMSPAVERDLTVCAGRYDKEAAQAGCLFYNLTNGEILESLL